MSNNQKPQSQEDLQNRKKNREQIAELLKEIDSYEGYYISINLLTKTKMIEHHNISQNFLRVDLLSVIGAIAK